MAQVDRNGVCPRHETALAPHEERGFKCLRCGDCAGLFVDRSALLGLLPSPGNAAALQALPASTVACARCGVTMRMRIHRGVEVDVCPQCHSVWLDAGEWEGIAKPGSTKGSKFGRTVTLTGAAAAAAAAGAAIASGTPAGNSGNRANTSSTVADIGETVADVAIEGGVEVVFTFIGEALGSLF